MNSHTAAHPCGGDRPVSRLLARGLDLTWGDRTLVMGILNTTPDSFSDGGRYLSADDAVRRGERMVEEGADLIDIGGESSRPGSEAVPLDEELRRVLPVLEALSRRVSIPLSIDTVKAEVARRALEAGARLINDISALSFDPKMAPLAAQTDAAVVLMHAQGRPRDMQINPVYEDVTKDIARFFEERLLFAERQGIPRERIILDPGLGFGKNVDHNLEILARLGDFRALGRPLLLGPSRKSFIGRVLGLSVGDRLEGTAAAVAAGILNGASIIRVHDVAAMTRVARMTDAILRGRHV
ncbi:MAG TPA: dihydropteroate synthase [Nitrospiria bacterium]